MLEQTIPKHLAQKGRVCKCNQCNLKKDGHEIVPGKIFLSSILDVSNGINKERGRRDSLLLEN
jgi:hypothetical protein